MTTVNIAFSGGIESTYLLQLALEKGFRVNLCMINVGGIAEARIAEVIAAEQIIKFFKQAIAEDKAYTPRKDQRFKGEIVDVMHMPVCPWLNRQEVMKSLVTFDVTQQFGTVLGMLFIRREYLDDFMPSTWIGWIKQDAAEFTFNEMDFTEDEYGALLKLPTLIGPLSNADNIGVEFRAPLWNMSKKEIYDSIIDEVKPLIIPNGTLYIDWGTNTVHHTPLKTKAEEWEQAGAIAQKEYVYKLQDASWLGRYVCGALLPADVGLDDSVEPLLRSLAPYFARGRTLIRPKDVDSIRREIPVKLRDLIRSAQSMAPMPTEEELEQAKRKEREQGSTVSS